MEKEMNEQTNNKNALEDSPIDSDGAQIKY